MEKTRDIWLSDTSCTCVFLLRLGALGGTHMPSPRSGHQHYRVVSWAAAFLQVWGALPSFASVKSSFWSPPLPCSQPIPLSPKPRAHYPESLSPFSWLYLLLTMTTYPHTSAPPHPSSPLPHKVFPMASDQFRMVSSQCPDSTPQSMRRRMGTPSAFNMRPSSTPLLEPSTRNGLETPF